MLPPYGGVVCSGIPLHTTSWGWYYVLLQGTLYHYIPPCGGDVVSCGDILRDDVIMTSSCPANYHILWIWGYISPHPGGDVYPHMEGILLYPYIQVYRGWYPSMWWLCTPPQLGSGGVTWSPHDYLVMTTPMWRLCTRYHPILGMLSTPIWGPSPIYPYIQGTGDGIPPCGGYAPSTTTSLCW